MKKKEKVIKKNMSDDSSLKNWKSLYKVVYLKNDNVLYNAVDSLSIYSNYDMESFLDLVHHLEQFCIIYEKSCNGNDHKNYNYINWSSKYQIALSNIILSFQENVIHEWNKLKKNDGSSLGKMDNESELVQRGQAILAFLNDYHINILKNLNMK